MDLTPKEIEEAQKLADSLGVELAALLAVVQTESNGKVFAAVDGRAEPLIRWEGHYFDRLVPASKREQARKAGLAHPTAGKVKNPSQQKDRYALLAKARKIDNDAALMSCSWGVGQVMCSHWEDLGFTSPDEFAATARTGFFGQLDIMCRYIKRNGLVDELQRHDWSGFARGYNGPLFRKYNYDTNMKLAYIQWAGKPSIVSPASGMLRMGSQGKRVRELQELLSRAGFPIAVDGDYGPATRDAVRAFQAEMGLEADGIAGPKTLQRILDYKVDPVEEAGRLKAIDNDKVKGGAVTLFGGVSAATVASQITDIADRVGVTGIDLIDHAVQAMYVVSGVLVLGGTLYAVWGHWKAQQTYEGVT